MPRHRPISQYFLLISQTLMAAICIVSMFSGHYPPAHAQNLKAEPTTIEDALQDRSIAEINTHLESTDSAAALTKTRQWDQINLNTKTLEGLAGDMKSLHDQFKAHIDEEHDIAGLLAFLATSGVVVSGVSLSRRGRKREAA